jgi:hypothetical protein|tara:strand:+ start:888 stop:2069 length:1182 start_codon:yes stop_codon:yes gene_type:complete
MRRVGACLLALLMIPIASAAFTTSIQLTVEDKLADNDIGLSGGELSPNNEKILLFGVDGYSHILMATSANDRTTDIDLEKKVNHSLNAAAWHPRGNTAYLVGQSGTMLRYVGETHAIETIQVPAAIADEDLTAMSWVQSGTHAYVAAQSGNIWKYSNGSGFEALNDSKETAITDITCHKSDNGICIGVTLNDGVFVIDRDAILTWISGTSSDTWIGISCDDGALNECTTYGSNARIGTLRINPDVASSSTMELIWELKDLGGDLIGENRGIDSSTLLYTAPFGLIRQNPDTTDSNTLLLNEDLIATDTSLAGDSLVMAWENDVRTGFMITSRGSVISFEPLTSELTDSMLATILAIVVVISVPGVLIGMIYWNSPWLQRKYLQLRGFDKKKKK